MFWKRKRPLITSKLNSPGVKTSVSFLKPYNFLITCCGRSKREYFRFFNKLPTPSEVRSKKSYFFSLKWIEILTSTETLTIFVCQSLTIIVDRDLILKIENLPLIFHPGAFAELGIRKALSRWWNNSRHFWNLLSLEKFRTTNIGKGWPNKNLEKISGQNQSLFEKENFGKIMSNI